MRKVLLVLIVAAFSFGCKKDNGNGSGSGLNTYLPLTDGTNWTYKFTSATGTNTDKLTVQAGTFTLSGRSYKRVLNTANTDTSHYIQSGNDYYSYFNLGGILGSVELNVLRDNVPVGTNWTNSKNLGNISVPMSPIPLSFTANFAFTIDGKDLTRTVSGKAYNTIIKVKLAINANNALLGNFPIGDGEFYFAKNIGLIEYSLNTSNPLGGGGAGGTTGTKREMQSYEIK